MTAQPFVEFRGLTRQFNDRWAVRDLTWSIGRGELFGLVGPDGAGKTTTLRMLAGILRPTSGDAVIDGVGVAGNPEAVKPKLAYMSQRFGLYGDLTVSENIRFYADLYGVPVADRPARLDRLYAFSNLGPFRHRLADQLSGGMKQKLSLCCALIHTPRLLLLDEPTFGVDPISRRDLWLIIHQMVAEGVTVVASTAYLDEAERCDRVALLHHGRAIALASPGALQARFRGEILLVQTPEPRRTRDRLREHPDVASAHTFGNAVHAVATNAAAIIPAIRASLGRDGIPVEEIRPVSPSLEDVFIQMTAPAGTPDD